jgi:colicin import membrane protein
MDIIVDESILNLADEVLQKELEEERLEKNEAIMELKSANAKLVNAEKNSQFDKMQKEAAVVKAEAERLAKEAALKEAEAERLAKEFAIMNAEREKEAALKKAEEEKEAALREKEVYKLYLFDKDPKSIALKLGMAVDEIKKYIAVVTL